MRQLFENTLYLIGHRLEWSSDIANFTLCLVLLLLLLLVPALPVFSASLPQQIGIVNDYGNVLSMEDREVLNDCIRTLQNHHLTLITLVSKRDPYNNPGYYAGKIAEEWGLSQGEADGLIVFVKKDKGWSVVFNFDSELITTLNQTGAVGSYKQLLRNKAAEGNIRQGLKMAYKQLRQAIREASVSNNTHDSSDWGFLSFFPFLPIVVGTGITGFVAITFFVLRIESRRRCPKCGNRLQKGQTGFANHEGSTKWLCKNCGYSEWR